MSDNITEERLVPTLEKERLIRENLVLRQEQRLEEMKISRKNDIEMENLKHDNRMKQLKYLQEHELPLTHLQ